VPGPNDAVKLVTAPANLSRLGTTGPRQRFAVNHQRVLRALRQGGAGKAEARDLALRALEEVGGGAEVRPSRGAQRGARSGREVETWWIPAEAVRFEKGSDPA